MNRRIFQTLICLVLLGSLLLGSGDRRLARVKLQRPSQLAEITREGIIIDRVRSTLELEVWVSQLEFQNLKKRGIEVRYIPNRAKLYADSLASATSGSRNPLLVYHDYNELTDFMDSIATNYPDIAQCYSIGQSVQGRELWVMKLSDNVSQHEPEPEFKYIANMHGDEPPGRELCINLIRWLVYNYEVDLRAKRLLDSLQIYIMPSMNPDGFEVHSRFNAHGVDLNRNFPDRIIDPYNTPDGREPETAAVMNWSASHNFVLSANFHSGALVANYPYDGNETGANVYTPTPDDELFIDLALEYSIHNQPMYNSPYFPNGITNGADWYVIYGGMQDWNYVWMGDFEITVEVSDIKWPPVSQLPALWNDNRESMLAYMEKIFTGIHGFIVDSTTGIPLKANITIDSNPHVVFSDSIFGMFTRVALPGYHSVTFSAPGYISKTVDSVLVVDGSWSELQVMLLPEGYAPPSSPGDVNQDGEVDIMDVVLIVNYILGYIDLSGDAFQSADWNQDSEVNVSDIVGIVNYILNGG